MTSSKPGVRPHVPHFSSGPCAKRPGWSLQTLTDALTGRSHRSKLGRAKLKRAIDLTREVLGVPADYRIAIVPASDTGAIEMAMWSMLGARAVTVLTWESFGEGWVTDVVKHLKLDDVTVLRAPYGELPDLSKVDAASDIVFTWNGTTSMRCVEDYLDALRWAKSIGGVAALIARADANARAIADWVGRTPWVDFLARDPGTRSNTSVCLKVVDPVVAALPIDAQAAFARAIAAMLEKEGIAFDIAFYRDAPPGLRVWCGSTIEAADVEALTPWLDWAFGQAKDALRKAA